MGHTFSVSGGLNAISHFFPDIQLKKLWLNKSKRHFQHNVCNNRRDLSLHPHFQQFTELNDRSTETLHTESRLCWNDGGNCWNDRGNYMVGSWGDIPVVLFCLIICWNDQKESVFDVKLLFKSNRSLFVWHFTYSVKLETDCYPPQKLKNPFKPTLPVNLGKCWLKLTLTIWAN